LDRRIKPVNYRLDAADVEFLRALFYDDVLEFQRLTDLRVSDWLTVNPNITIPARLQWAVAGTAEATGMIDKLPLVMTPVWSRPIQWPTSFPRT
jgi:hypothetical protein